MRVAPPLTVCAFVALICCIRAHTHTHTARIKTNFQGNGFHIYIRAVHSLIRHLIYIFVGFTAAGCIYCSVRKFQLYEPNVLLC